MIRTGDEYRDSIRDGRSVWIDGERVTDVATHPAFRPIVDARARIYDMAHDPATRERMSYVDAETGERCPTGAKLPHTREDWHAKRAAGRHRARRPGRDRHPRRRRDRRRDVVAVRRPGRARRDRPAVLRAHPPPRAPRRARRPVPRLGQHRPQGRAQQAPPGPGPRRPAARRRRDRQRDRRARRQVRDRGGLRQPGVRQADDRRLGPTGAVGLRRRLHRRHGRARHPAHLPLLVRPARPRRGLPAVGPLRRDRHHDRLRRRRDPVGERPLLPPHPRGRLHPRDAAPLQHVRLRPAPPALRRPAGGRGGAQRQPDRGQGAPGRAREAGRAGLLPRGHPRAPDGGHRARRAQPRRPAHAQPGAALHRPRAGLHPAAGDDAPRPRPVRRPALRHARARPPSRIPRRGRGWTSTSPSATSTPSSGAGCSRSRATCSTPTTPGTGSPSSCSRSPRRSRTCWPSTTTTTSRARWSSCGATRAWRPAPSRPAAAS